MKTPPLNANISPADEHKGDRCFTKRSLSAFLGISTRSWDRAVAMGLTPPPDLLCGSSPRWSPATIEKWLRSRPRLPGRGKGVRHGE